MKKTCLTSMVIIGSLMASLVGCGSTDTGTAGSEEETLSSESSREETTSESVSADLALTDSESESMNQVSQKTIGIAMPTRELERWNRDGAYLESHFREAGYDTKVVYSENSAEQQIEDLADLIEEDVDLLVVAAVDGGSLAEVLEGAKDKEIPVIAYDRLIMDTDAVSYYISFDNYKVGWLQGQYVIDTLDLDHADGETYHVEFTGGDPRDHNALYFFNGAYDALTPYIAVGTVAVPSGQTTFEEIAIDQWSVSGAQDRFQNILQSCYSDETLLDAVICANDSTALGVTQAIEADYTKDNEVIITGQDGDEANLRNIIDGKQSMTVYKAVANEAIVTFDLGLAILAGETPDASLVEEADWEFECVYDIELYHNNVIPLPSYLLSPIVITADNLQKELVDTGYYIPDEEGYPKAVSGESE